MKHLGKVAIVAWAIVLLAVGCNKAQPKDGGQPVSSSASQQQATSSDQTLTPSGQTQTRQNAGGSDYQPGQTAQPPTSSAQIKPSGQAQTVQNADKPDYTPGYVIVTDTVEGSNLNHLYDKVKDGTTAYNLLASTHQVTAKDYGSGMGEMVQTIDGIKPGSGQFWEFLVNGQFSNVGASSYILKDGDSIEWKMEVIK